jgi:hypothetical protein
MDADGDGDLLVWRWLAAAAWSRTAVGVIAAHWFLEVMPEPIPAAGG